MNRDRAKQDQSEIVREAFRAATDSPEPDLSRIREAIPGLMARAAEIRAAKAEADTFAVLGFLAGRMLPRFAAAAALLALIAVALGPQSASSRQTEEYAIDNLVLTGEIDDSATDILLEGLLLEGSDNG